MKTLVCGDPNQNVTYLVDLIHRLTERTEDCDWIVADLELVPIFKGDYSGVGKEEAERATDALLHTIKQNKVVRLDYESLMRVLEDTLTVGNAVFICVPKSCPVDFNTYCPRVESERKQMYDSRANYEIRILDGDLFFVFTE